MFLSDLVSRLPVRFACVLFGRGASRAPGHGALSVQCRTVSSCRCSRSHIFAVSTEPSPSIPLDNALTLPYVPPESPRGRHACRKPHHGHSNSALNEPAHLEPNHRPPAPSRLYVLTLRRSSSMSMTPSPPICMATLPIAKSWV